MTFNSKKEFDAHQISLLHQGTIDAVEEMKKKFRSPQDFDKIPTLKDRYSAAFAALETQLSTATQQQLDELQKELNSLQNIYDEVADIKTRICSIDELSDKTKNSFSHYKHIRQITICRRNLRVTLEQIDFFNQVPQRCHELHELLLDNYRSLKEVYTEWKQLLSWKTDVLRELAVQAEEIRNSSSSSKQKQKAAENQEAIKSTLADKFQLMEALGEVIKARLWEHIQRCFEMSELDPASLVKALEIIERRDIGIEKRIKRLKSQAKARGEDPDDIMLDPSETTSWREQCKSILKQTVKRRIERLFGNEECIKNDVSGLLKAGNVMVSDLEHVHEFVVPCFPPQYIIIIIIISYNVMDLFLKQYKEAVLFYIAPLFSINTLDQGQVLQCVEWLDSFKEELTNYNAESYFTEFYAFRTQLMARYSEAVSEQMTVWIANIYNRYDDPILNEYNNYVTPKPDDTFAILSNQIEVVNERLHGQSLLTVVQACMQVFAPFQHRIIEGLKNNPTEYLEELCATVNDAFNLQEKFEDIPYNIPDLSEKDMLEMSNAVSDVVAEYVKVGQYASDLLVNLIMSDIQPHLDEYLFQQAWIEGSVDPLGNAIETINDYLGDLKEWISCPYYVGYIVKECFLKLIAGYFTVFKKCKGWHEQEIDTVVERIVDDQTTIRDYFSSNEIILLFKMSGCEIRTVEQIDDQLYLTEELKNWLFKSESDFIDGDPPAVSEYVQETLYKFGQTAYAGPECIKALILCRLDLLQPIKNELQNYCKEQYAVTSTPKVSDAIKKKFDNIKERTAAVFKKNIISESSDVSGQTPPPQQLQESKYKSVTKSFMQGFKANFTNDSTGSDSVDPNTMGSVGSSFNASIRAIKSKFGGNE